MSEQKNWKVVIADDEEMIRRLIAALIPWEELNLELTASVSNGLEAIEYLKDHPADILITDARMPECDGIQLVKWCSEQGRDMKYIVISGYRQFEYAHGALQYGADNYLLKPINQQELITTLKSISQKLEAGRNPVKSDQVRAQINLNRDRMRRHFVNSYMYDGRAFPDREIPSVDYINEEYQMHFADGVFRAVLFRIEVPENHGMNLERITARILQEVENRWKETMTECIGSPVDSGVLFFVNYHESGEELLKNDLEDLYEKLVKVLDPFEGARLTIGSGCRKDSLKAIRECLLTASDAIKYRLYLPHVSIIDYEHYTYKNVPVGTIWTQERRHLLENHMRTGNQKGVQKLLFDLKLEIHRDREISPVSIYETAETVAENVMDVLDPVLENSTRKNDLMNGFLRELEEKTTVDGIITCLEKTILKCMEILEEETKQQEIQPIRIIREYIDEHYAENISLNDVADRVHLSRNYVSAIFRKETGVNYLDFLTSKRIDEAAELLRKTGLSIGEVAEKVGYTDVKYFSKMFKKKLGMNPSEYRKLYS